MKHSLYVSCTDTAYSCDPRVRRFKEAEKAEKLARKRAKDEATRREILERERVNESLLLQVISLLSTGSPLTGASTAVGGGEGAPREEGGGSSSSGGTSIDRRLDFLSWDVLC